MNERPETGLARRAYELAVLTIPVALAVAATCLLFNGGVELFALWFDSTIEPKDRLQAGANLVGAALGGLLGAGGAFLAGMLAIRFERQQKEANKVREKKSVIDALKGWSIQGINALERLADGLPALNVPQGDRASVIARLRRQNAKCTTGLPKELFGRIVDHAPVVVSFTTLLEDSGKIFGRIMDEFEKLNDISDGNLGSNPPDLTREIAVAANALSAMHIGWEAIVESLEESDPKKTATLERSDLKIKALQEMFSAQLRRSDRN